MKNKLTPRQLFELDKEIEDLESKDLTYEEKIVVINKKFNTDYKRSSYQYLKKISSYVDGTRIMKENQKICEKWRVPDKVPEPKNYADYLADLMEGRISEQEFEEAIN